jgi:large subunit ribosomal protein L19
MQTVIKQIEDKYKKKAVVDIKSGDTIRVHQRIVEGGKERVQIFEGLVIRASRKGSLTSNFTVRRIASGIGVEKTFMIHARSVLKIEVTKRSKVRRNYLTYMRERTGKSARLTSVEFDRSAVNKIDDVEADAEEAEIKEAQSAEHAEAVERSTSESEKLPKNMQPDDSGKSEAEKLEEQPVERAEAKAPAQPKNKKEK